jgi:glycosyltransferase involved in cell wall biosynthesis
MSLMILFCNMQKLSVVIVCKNGAKVIGETIRSFSGLTDDILVYDNGSTDDTKGIVEQTNAKFVEGVWEGFGKTRNKATALAKYDWILSLDADEAIDEQLKNSLLKLDLAEEKKVFEFRFKNFLGNKWLRFGEWGDDKHIRLFNRRKIRWNDAAVHETLVLPAEVKVVRVRGFVLHNTAANYQEFENKMENYAKLNAEKYFKLQRSSGPFRMFLSASFSFAKNYFFKLGFLDGVTGYHCARINARYTFLKYKKLNELNQQAAIRRSQTSKTS